MVGDPAATGGRSHGLRPGRGRRRPNRNSPVPYLLLGAFVLPHGATMWMLASVQDVPLRPVGELLLWIDTTAIILTVVWLITTRASRGRSPRQRARRPDHTNRRKRQS